MHWLSTALLCLEIFDSEKLCALPAICLEWFLPAPFYLCTCILCRCNLYGSALLRAPLYLGTCMSCLNVLLECVTFDLLCTCILLLSCLFFACLHVCLILYSCCTCSSCLCLRVVIITCDRTFAFCSQCVCNVVCVLVNVCVNLCM